VYERERRKETKVGLVRRRGGGGGGDGRRWSGGFSDTMRKQSPGTEPAAM